MLKVRKLAHAGNVRFNRVHRHMFTLTVYDHARYARVMKVVFV
jgi:hypothetical protein